ncbi:hypothetical protein ABCS02_13270 [Microbacterium sp. X-17]|uniref:hypothetical protein n=1 Tax=Microbacterium sp. X-17 TaxID=3144404 RepID=UPI0031F4847A
MSGPTEGAIADTPVSPRRRRRSRRLAVDLSILGIVGVLLVGATVAGGVTVYRQFYSPTAFVLHYLGLLGDGRAADALALPGVAVDPTVLTARGLPSTASTALLRQAALGHLSDVHPIAEQADGDLTRVTVGYSAGGYPAQTTFAVRRDGTAGVLPAWRFDTSPLAIVDLTVLGSADFRVNGFDVDKNQVSAAADQASAVPLLVFSPGLYSVTVDTPVATADGVAVLADAPLTQVPVDVQAQPTAQFVSTVQSRVEQFLTDCTTQRVLQPTGCPFGYVVYNRIDGLPTWSMVKQPTVSIVPDGANWRIPGTPATAHIEVDIRSVSNGSLHHVSEDVPFLLDGSITTQSDGSLSIQLGGSATG